MHLLRVQVPEFRALKNVDITFEKDFTPKVFPLGSENGGGKSTLLQLIFVLLHCAPNPNRVYFVKNMLARYSLPEGVSHQVLAKMDIWEGDKIVQIEFLYCQDDFLKSFLGLSNLYDANQSSVNEKTVASLREKKFIYITNFCTQNDTKTLLCCRIADMAVNEAESLLSNLSEKFFLAMPATQVCLFMSQTDKNHFFQPGSSYEQALDNVKVKLPNFFTYDFFTYVIVKYFKAARDWDFEEAVKTGQYGNHYPQILNGMNQVLVAGKNILPQLRSQDAAPAYENDPIAGIAFQTDKGIVLEPEDLSHGELKRLSIYVWIQYRRIKEAIVLMDEVENAFHPDWQYRIISDLMEWGANNQYILATHSYELCQAVTPAHVKELEPKLNNNCKDYSV